MRFPFQPNVQGGGFGATVFTMDPLLGGSSGLSGAILLENGGYLLLENGGHILLENASASTDGGGGEVTEEELAALAYLARRRRRIYPPGTQIRGGLVVAPKK